MIYKKLFSEIDKNMFLFPKKLSDKILAKLSPETIEHISAIDIIRVKFPWVMDYLMHIPNERKCSTIWGYILQRMGVLKGAPDIFIMWPTQAYYGLFIEIKTKKGRPTKEQISFMGRAKAKGYYSEFGYGCDEVVQIVTDYLKPTHCQ